MKNLLSLLALTLWSLVSLAQTTTKIAELNPAPGKTGSKYFVYYERDWNKFKPTTSGLESLTTAIANGELELRVTTTGCIIPKGTRPPAVAPTCSQTVTAPSWLAGLQYRHDGTTMTVQTSGDVVQMAFDTSPKTTFSTTNPDGVPIASGEFKGYGQIANGIFNRQWQINKAPTSFSITAKNSSGNTYSRVFSATTGASFINLIGTTTDPPTSTTTIAYRPISKVWIASNSIGFFPYNPGFNWTGNWGAAASAENKDFFHILSDSVHTIYPNATVKLWGAETGISIAEGGYFEGNYDNLGDGLNRYNALADVAPDVFIVRLGENVTPPIRSTFQSSWKAMIDKVTSKSTNPLKIVTTSVWGDNDVDNALVTLGNTADHKLVDLRGIPGGRAGTANHPTDAAHAEYAKRIWAKMKTSLATTTSTTTTTPPTSGSVDAQGFLVYQDQGWDGADIKRIENSEMFLEFKRSVGAVVTGAGLKSNNRNVVADEQVTPNGITISDKGCQWQLSPYGNPSGNQPLTIGTQTVGGTGDNPVQGGSANPYFQPGVVEKSAIINTPDRGVVFCATVNGLLWDWFAVKGHMPVDIEWWFLPGNVITYKARLTVLPRPSTWSGVRKNQSLSQEMLCLYNIGAFNTHLANVNGQEISLRDGIPLGGQSNDYFTSGCWAATYQPDRQQGVLYYTPRNSIFKSWQKSAESGEWPDQGQAYINASLKRTYDIEGTQTIDNGYIILGSQASAMARMAQLEPIDQSYDFDFTSLNNQWWNEDARVMRNSNGSLRWYCGDEKFDNGQTNSYGRFVSPARAWQASQFQHVEFDMAVSGVNKLQLHWAKPGKFGQFEYTAEVNVIGDGTRRTYQFDLSSLPNWSGTITYLGLKVAVQGQPAAYADMYRARKF